MWHLADNAALRRRGCIKSRRARRFDIDLGPEQRRDKLGTKGRLKFGLASVPPRWAGFPGRLSTQSPSEPSEERDKWPA
ncbi:hypothetical protein DI396_08540 [Litorivita pollutaquae]|uniref:Uncharacterized protein n=1 Tax=Litorivita pollutaquae TaxID=2200892 RepID=A0A2V4NT92_9RHOB|nr:hypothetical protein DI396_08540 [Litorivita pollutaquae]